jgi:hypothetical protein
MPPNPATKSRIPPGLVLCETCGGFSGVTFEKHLARKPNIFNQWDYEPDRPVSALCRCHGPLCQSCGVNRIHRPVSGLYLEDVNMILHVPTYAAGGACEACTSRKRLEALLATQASLGPRDKAVHIPCELRPGESSRYGNYRLVTLSDDRIAWINAMLVMPTYASLVCGLPDPDSDAELILQARNRAVALCGTRPMHVIVPEYDCDVDVGRTHLRMPPWEYHVWLESGPIRGSAKAGSQLVVIWFGQRNWYVDLLESFERRLRSLPWDKLAVGCDKPGEGY